MMHLQQKLIRLIIFNGLLYAGLFHPAYSQNTINKVVEVVKPYEPTISDAYKINLLPMMNDTIRIKPTFNYNLISSKRIDSQFDVRPISAAKMVGLPLTKLYKTYLKFGIGNYTTLLGEMNINSLRSKDHNVGLYLKHLSSDGHIVLANDRNVYAGYGENQADLYGKKIIKNTILSGDLGVKANTVYFYGYNPVILDTVINNSNNIKQSYTDFNINGRLNSAYVDSSHVNYDLTSGYHYYTDLFGTREGDFEISGNFDKYFMKQMIGLGIEIRNINKTTNPGITDNIIIKSDTTRTSIVRVEPWWGKSQPEWSVKASLNAYFVSGKNPAPYFYPKIKFQFNAVENILIPYVGFDGHLVINSYKAITDENPFVKPGISAFNTSVWSLYGGLKGSLSSNASYNVYVESSGESGIVLFINDTLANNSGKLMGNRFIAIYDDAQVMGYHGDLSFKPSEKLNFEGKVNIYKYSMSREKKAWQQPSWNMSLSANYNLKDKIIVKADIFGIGKRYARPYNPIKDAPIELKGIADINLGFEYRYTKILSLFLNLNNITGSKYYMWNQYPSQGFNFLVGLTYAL